MSDRHLATYLNDHLAGSAAALELLEHLEETYGDIPVGRLAAELRAEVVADRRELEALMGRLGVAESRPRKAAAWLAGKAAELKLRLDDPAGGALRRLEALDGVSTGVEGKRLLWQALAAASADAPALRGPDYGTLIRRAESQRDRLEAARREAARQAFGAAPPNISASGSDTTPTAKRS